MIVNVGSIKGRKGASMLVQFEEPEPESPDEQIHFIDGTPLRVEARVTNTGICYLVQGNVEADLALTCSRCLKEYPWHLRVPLHEVYRPAAESDDDAVDTNGSPDSFDDLDDEIRSFHGSEIDLTEAVQEQIVLALPMKLLCREDCEGICPQCGVDRNETACDCRMETIDPRLAALKEWQLRTDAKEQ